MKKTKAKKATAGQRFVGIPDYCHTAEEAQAMVRAAQAIDRAIAAAVRKERKRCVAVIEKHQAASFSGAVRHEAFVCDDLIAAIREAKP